MSSPLCLSDSELDAIFAAARPIAVDRRDEFLQRVAELLREERELGDGVIARACRTAQKEFFEPPNLERSGVWSKYA
jgi:hypothetical protein